MMRATRVGADASLSQIVKLVENAQLAKAPIQAFGTRYPASSCLSPRGGGGMVHGYAAGEAGYFPDSFLPEGETKMVFALMFGVSVLVTASLRAWPRRPPRDGRHRGGRDQRDSHQRRGRLGKGGHVSVIAFDKQERSRLGTRRWSRSRSSEASSRKRSFCASSPRRVADEHPIARAVMKYANAAAERAHASVTARRRHRVCRGSRTSK